MPDEIVISARVIRAQYLPLRAGSVPRPTARVAHRHNEVANPRYTFRVPPEGMKAGIAAYREYGHVSIRIRTEENGHIGLSVLCNHVDLVAPFDIDNMLIRGDKRRGSFHLEYESCPPTKASLHSDHAIPYPCQ